MTHVGQKFLDDKITYINIHEVAMAGHNDQMSPEDLGSDILCRHYGSLSQSLQYPIMVSRMLYQERVISKTAFAIIIDTAKSLSGEKATFLLLKEVRQAVHTNYHNLEVFASVLLKFTSNVPCANAILKDYGKCMTHL